MLFFVLLSPSAGSLCVDMTRLLRCVRPPVFRHDALELCEDMSLPPG
jgi:hypothetical protein